MGRSDSGRPRLTGGLLFAATVLPVVGIWQVLVGVTAIANDEFLIGNKDHPYEIDATVWGWLHLVMGVLAVLAGVFLFVSVAVWARAVGIALAWLSAVNSFAFLPHYPLWALTVIAVDMVIIWSLASADSSRERPLRDSAGDDTGSEAWRVPTGRPVASPADLPPLGRI